MTLETAFVILTLGPVAIAFVACLAFMVWDDIETARFYRDLNSRR